MFNTVITCCFHCTKREVGCHSTCEEYLAQRAEFDELQAKENANRVVTEYKQESSNRARKKMHRNKGKKYFVKR